MTTGKGRNSALFLLTDIIPFFSGFFFPFFLISFSIFVALVKLFNPTYYAMQEL
jgi:hypothetical protein